LILLVEMLYIQGAFGFVSIGIGVYGLPGFVGLNLNLGWLWALAGMFCFFVSFSFIANVSVIDEQLKFSDRSIQIMLLLVDVRLPCNLPYPLRKTLLKGR